MITLEKIEEDLVRIESGEILPENTVLVAVQVDDVGRATHSALLIGVEGDYFLFHFTSTEVLLDPAPLNEWYFCKELEVVNGEEFSLDFLAHCENIIIEETPNFGMWFDGSYYDENGRHFTDSSPVNYTTCVGFCIRVITGFLISKSKYFELDDWDTQSVENLLHTEFFANFVNEFRKKYPDVSDEQFWASCK